MRIYGLTACDTCRKARKALPRADFVDVRDMGIEAGLLARALETFGLSLLNTRSTTWRGLDQAERVRPPLDLIKDYPALMKRPLIEADGQLHLGWTPDVRAALGAG